MTSRLDIQLFRLRRLLVLALSAGLLGAGLTACGDAGTTDRNNANIRLVNATGKTGGYAQLALRLNDVVKQGQVAYGEAASYVSVDDGSATLAISAQGAASNLLSSSAALAKGRYYTVLAYGRLGDLRQVLLDDNQVEPELNKSSLRVVNAVPDSGSLDVFVLAAGENLDTAVPRQPALAFGSVGEWNTLNSGSWRLVVTAANNRNDVRLDQSSLNLGSRQIGTLVLSAGIGGMLSNAVLLAQRSAAVTQLDNTQARVRVIAGLDGVGAVTVNVGGTPLVNGVAPVSVSNYALATSTTTSTTSGFTLTVAGVERPISGTPPPAGSDYTLLVFGNTSTTAQQAGALAPQGVWVNDLDSARSLTQARVRLVNGLSDPASRLSLTVNLFSVAGSIAPGTASTPYADTAPGTTRGLRVTRESDGKLLGDKSEALEAGKTYSVLMLGSAAQPVFTVLEDR